MTRLSVMNEKAPKPQMPTLRHGDEPRPYDYAPDESTDKGRIEKAVVEALSEIYDPEIPVNIFELGLIYGVHVDDEHRVKVTMTLTAPNCPVAQSLPEDVKKRAAAAEGVTDAEVEVTWSPPWNRGMMTEEAQLELNL